MLICAWGAVRWLSNQSPVPPVVVVSNGPTITQLQAIGSLAVLKVSIADVLQASGNRFKGSWLVKGDALFAVDCRRATLRDVDEKLKTAVIVLPPPTILQPRVDHDRTREWSVERDSWVPFVGDESAMRAEAMRQAQHLVEAGANTPETLGVARQNAEMVIGNMYRLVDWKVTVEWYKDESATNQDASPPVN